jgi:hypothetical protein
MKTWLPFAVPLLALAYPDPVGACSIVGNPDHQVDQAYADDETPPGAVTASVLVRRFDQGGGGGCGGTAVSSCYDVAFVEVMVAASDDAAPADQLGYQVRVASGQAPAGMTPPAGAIRATEQGVLVLPFSYMESGFSFELEVRAVDLNGNLGPPTLVAVAD